MWLVGEGKMVGSDDWSGCEGEVSQRMQYSCGLLTMTGAHQLGNSASGKDFLDF